MALAAVLCFQWPAAGTESSVPFALNRDKIVVPVALDESGPHPFVLDLGAAQPVLADTLAAQLNLATEPGDATEVRSKGNTPVEVTTVRVRKLSAGGLAARDVQCLAMDLSPLTARLGASVAGLFSGRTLADEVTIDLAAKRAWFRRPATPGVWDGATALRMNLGGGLEVSAVVNGAHVRPLELDTTSGDTLAIPAQALAEMGLLRPDTPRLEMMPEAADGTGSPPHTQIRLGSVRIGPVRVNDPVCTVLAGDAPGRVGLGFLRRCRTSVHFGKGLLLLEPVVSMPWYDPPIVGYGLCPARQEKDGWTAWVAKRSPAARAGLRSGDLLTAIDGQALPDLTYAEVSVLLATELDGLTTVTAARGEALQTVTLRAERLL